MIGPADIEAWREDADEAKTAAPKLTEPTTGAAPIGMAPIGAPARASDRPRRRLIAKTVAQGYAEIAALRRLFGRWM